MDIDSKIVSGLARISDVLKTLLWDKAKVYGISPIQIQILLFISNHPLELSNVSYLAKEYNLTKPTISDAIRVLVEKKLLVKDYSPTDKRRFNLLVSKKGKQLVKELSDYPLPISTALEELSIKEKNEFFRTTTKLIFQLNKAGIIKVQRTCYNCLHYTGNKNDKHYCNLLEQRLKVQELRLDCNEYEELVR